jgi:hypothetical protein
MGRHPLVLPDDARVQQTTEGLIAICREVQRRAPSANVVLVGYLPLFDEPDAAVIGAGFNPDQVEYFRQVQGLLSGAYSEASRHTGAGLVATSGYPGGHGVGSADPWLFGRQPLRSLGASFHPNEGGMRAVASTIIHHLDHAS